jgi:hypothetical protein
MHLYFEKERDLKEFKNDMQELLNPFMSGKRCVDASLEELTVALSAYIHHEMWVMGKHLSSAASIFDKYDGYQDTELRIVSRFVTPVGDTAIIPGQYTTIHELIEDVQDYALYQFGHELTPMVTLDNQSHNTVVTDIMPAIFPLGGTRLYAGIPHYIYAGDTTPLKPISNSLYYVDSHGLYIAVYQHMPFSASTYKNLYQMTIFADATSVNPEDSVRRFLESITLKGAPNHEN